ncbi:MAG TPA: peptidyl-tRNA hydrolase Pth2 [candidate division Zixibacteria bacterium]|nr:peptidyl-tRNA hydrolase Pth2 [candidate division Zixibacteria bacterium]
MFPDDFQFKMVIALRTDLKMTKGKSAVQASHAAVIAVEEAKRKKLDWVKKWFYEGQKKVVVQVSSKEELELLYQKAQQNNFPCSFVNDAGLTELPPGTATAVAIGPAPNNLIDKITSNLKLL